MNRVSVLFTGYAPVHFLCFRPLFEALSRLPGMALFVSGGRRRSTSEGFAYDLSMYEAFGIPQGSVLSVDEIQDRRFDVLFSANKRQITPPENITTRVQIFHGVSFRNRGVRPENLTYDTFFLIGPYMRRKFVEAGLLRENDPRGVPIGFPKTDALFNGKLNRQQLLKCYSLDGRRPVLLYAPTGELDNSLETMGKEVISRLSNTGKYDLLIKPHDHPKNSRIDWYAELASLEDAHTRVVRDLDVIPLLLLADLLITDASSVGNEFALLNRPIVFLDVPELLQRSQQTGAALDLQTWGRRGGLVVRAPSDVTAAVKRALDEPDELSQVRAALAKDLFYNPGHATEAVMNWFAGRFLETRLTVNGRSCASSA